MTKAKPKRFSSMIWSLAERAPVSSTFSGSDKNAGSVTSVPGAEKLDMNASFARGMRVREQPPLDERKGLGCHPGHA